MEKFFTNPHEHHFLYLKKERERVAHLYLRGVIKYTSNFGESLLFFYIPKGIFI